MQKFPFILDEIGSEHRERWFAIVIDEANSSQGGRTSAALSTALPPSGAEEDDETLEDRINRLMEAKKLLPNASYFALITEEIPGRVAADKACENAKRNSDRQNARIEHDKALARVMTAVLKDDTELFKQFRDNESFRRWLRDTVFSLTYPENPRV